ncbi:MAG: EAL domain-containing protein [Gammaproteobacteria bacterium]|nr:EAL domain-containing protein [Gammaproteobacteria bacterium]MBU1647462.1 EAL domain-containing protein [Gammaproteobacteria bacterium]MBU1972911.1 EAL domain-containing protein [Gammaproteobacteria bacterium]
MFAAGVEPVVEAPASRDGVGVNLRRRILLPLALALLFLLSAFAYSIYRTERAWIEESTGRELKTIQASLGNILKLRGDKLHMALDQLDRDPRLRPMLRTGDRGVLRDGYADLFAQLKREFGITHLYFIRPDRLTLLRLHQPERFGDRIDRYTLREAERTGHAFAGMELGPIGTLSLRAVMPVRDGSELLGYVELAEEVQDVVQDITRIFGSEGFVTIHKDVLSRPDWEEGMRMLGRQPDWDRFPHSVMTFATLAQVPPGLGRLLPEGQHPQVVPAAKLEQGDLVYQSGFVPLTDAGGRDVGDLVVLRDVTAAMAHTRQTVGSLVAAAAVVAALLFLLFYLILGRAKNALAMSRNRLIAETGNYARLQAQRIEELTTWVDERTRTDEQLRIAASAFESQEAMFVTTPDGVILRINQAFTTLTGYDGDEVIGQTPALLKSGKHDAGFYRQLWQALAADRCWQGEIWNRRKDGSLFPAWQTISAVVDGEGRISHYVSAFSDMTRHKQAEADIQQLAYYDQLTGLPNRRLLLERLGQALATSARDGRHGALLFIDLDHFKMLNDTRGHDVGDRLLVEVARWLQGCIHEGDTVARLGGDEFVVMLEGLSEDGRAAATQTEMIGERIRSTLDRECAFAAADGNAEVAGDHHCSASIGVDLFLGHRETTENLLKHADVAMYQAKAAGRNALHFFDPAMQARLEGRAALEADLRRALSLGQLELYYQVQVGPADSVLGAEVLLRWNHPLRGVVSPVDFIPLAEETGLIVPIGHWVLEMACHQLRKWQDDPATRDFVLAVNVSARQFRQPDFVDQVHAVLDHTGANPNRLKLELTESLVLDDIDSTIAKMNTLKSLGIGFSMDDFGTGYSSLSHLKRLPLDQVKIDRSFVRDIATDPGDAVIVRTIIAMADSLGLTVVAEGVENREQLDFLVEHACPVFQGYLFSRPVPLGEFQVMLNKSAGER